MPAAEEGGAVMKVSTMEDDHEKLLPQFPEHLLPQIFAHTKKGSNSSAINQC